MLRLRRSEGECRARDEDRYGHDYPRAVGLFDIDHDAARAQKHRSEHDGDGRENESGGFQHGFSSPRRSRRGSWSRRHRRERCLLDSPVHHQYPSAPEIKDLRTVHASANERISRLRSQS